MQILGLNKTTLLDYPEHVAATIFTGGCNFRCLFCHNAPLVFQQPDATTAYSTDEVLSFLSKRKGILTGVCVSGGEPTLQPDLADFVTQIKSLGYLVKLDTNGCRPDVLTRLIGDGLIDCCAMDIKNSPDKYAITAGVTALDITPVMESVNVLLQGALPYEFRTTIVRELHTEDDMRAIARWLSGARAYYLQSYKDSEQVITAGYHAHDTDTLRRFADICRARIPNTQLRGIDA